MDTQDKNTKDNKEESNKSKSDSTKEEKPNVNLEPPRFFNISEGVNPKIYSDEAVKEKENK
jgi:hypothetical protein